MVVTAVVSGVILDKPMFSIVFGGISIASLLTVVIWKPYEMTFWATITTQGLEMILALLEQEWAIAGEILDPKERSDQIRKINRFPDLHPAIIARRFVPAPAHFAIRAVSPKRRWPDQSAVCVRERLTQISGKGLSSQ